MLSANGQRGKYTNFCLCRKKKYSKFFINFRAEETPVEAANRKKAHRDNEKNSWNDKPEPVRQKRSAAIAGAAKTKKMAEDEASAADRRRVEANKKMDKRTAK